MAVSAHGVISTRVLKAGITLTATAVAVQSLAHVVNVAALDYESNVLDANSDTGGPAWASSVVQFTAAVFVSLLAAGHRSYEQRLLGLAALLAFFSFDDIIQVHERVDAVFPWPVAYLPLLAVAFLGLWVLAERAAGDVRRLMRIGLGFLVLAVALELAGEALDALDVGRLDAPYVATIVLEEGAELAGWGLIATGLAAAVLAVRDTSP